MLGLLTLFGGGSDPPPAAPPGSCSAAEWLFFDRGTPAARGISRAYLLLCAEGAPAVAVAALVPTDLGTLCAAARDALRAGFTMPDGSPIAAQAVNVGLDRQTFPASTVPQILVIPEVHAPHAATVSGGGRRTPVREGQITALFIARYTRDRVDTANFLVSDPDSGAYPWLAGNIDDVLTTEFLADGSGNTLTIEPLELVNHSNPRPYGKGFEFYGVEMTWRVRWLQRMTIRAGE